MDGRYQLNEDYIFDSPSAAASLFCGVSTNGWDVFVNSDGKKNERNSQIKVCKQISIGDLGMSCGCGLMRWRPSTTWPSSWARRHNRVMVALLIGT
ncbi:MAG: DUF4357 domain-containing protein [Bacteroidales bacterium]|nr:DUF4357 domain-containing protein [Bacteroidales bacterium]